MSGILKKNWCHSKFKSDFLLLVIWRILIICPINFHMFPSLFVCLTFSPHCPSFSLLIFLCLLLHTAWSVVYHFLLLSFRPDFQTHNARPAYWRYNWWVQTPSTVEAIRSYICVCIYLANYFYYYLGMIVFLTFFRL